MDVMFVQFMMVYLWVTLLILINFLAWVGI